MSDMIAMNDMKSQRAERRKALRLPMSPQNCAFSLQFPLNILKTHSSNRCRPTTCAKCPRKLRNSGLTFLSKWQRRLAGGPRRRLPCITSSVSRVLGNVNAELHRSCTVSASFLKMHFTTHYSPTTYKTHPANRCNSGLTLPSLVASRASRIRHHTIVTAELDRSWTVSGPFSNSLFITHCSPTTCKIDLQKRSDSLLTLLRSAAAIQPHELETRQDRNRGSSSKLPLLSIGCVDSRE